MPEGIPALATSMTETPPTTGADLKRLRIVARGRVQGVGFRPTFYRALTERSCAGSIRNTPEGVVLEVEGPAAVLDEFVRDFHTIAPARADITELDLTWCQPTGQKQFVIDASSSGGRSLLPIPPDLAVCERCVEELLSDRDHRRRYPFITCTECGPRFTIARLVPFDRSRSAMDEFLPCAQCSNEYRSPSQRRFHAQTISCQQCGPVLRLLDTSRRTISRPLHSAVSMLRDGKLLALKGLGGFHLACNATQDEAVQELRRRKKRPCKPFALMVGSIEAARRICHVSEAEENILRSAQAPIVLLRKRNDTPISEQVAPALLYNGVMLPYTPLHVLLFDDERCPDALVMTSCNRSEEPIAITEDAVLGELGDIVDAVLTHDRQIANRCDDSVVVVFRDAEFPTRRSRGYVPEPLLLGRDGPPVLATGAMLANTFALTSGRRVFISQHIGDVSDADNAAHFAESFRTFSQLLRVEPEIVACDLHPDYPTSAFARELAERKHLPLVQVQHHHAHIAACLAEHGVGGPVIGVSMDGTGFGEDGAVWGGEFLVADLAKYERRYHLAYVPMPGGEQAVVEPDRMAVSHLAAALGPEACLERMSPLVGATRCRRILEIMSRRSLSPLTSSCGRLFDAVSALLEVCHEMSYEGQPSIELEMCCAAADDGSYPFGYNAKEIMIGDLLRGICADLDAGVPREVIAARFHRTVADIILETCRRLRDETGLAVTALSGGVMQNRRLLGLVVPALERDGFEVLLHRKVPPNDGGICLGQAASALARLRL